jgi:hypothetical protein
MECRMFETPTHYNKFSLLLLNTDTYQEARWVGSCGRCKGPVAIKTGDVELKRARSVGVGVAAGCSWIGSCGRCEGPVCVTEETRYYSLSLQSHFRQVAVVRSPLLS